MSQSSDLLAIEDAIRRLSAEDRAYLIRWIAEFDNQAWDEQIQEDIAAGRLDALAEEARGDLDSGRCTDR